MGKIRGTHSSPGFYSQFTDLTYAAKTLGITTLGLVGETKKGPAFEPIPISTWGDFTQYFGGTSAEKFKDSLYPKYELPYIAKSYLKASDQLYVCRVLGLSGYNAGPAWLLTADLDGGKNKYVIGVLRARGSYSKYSTIGDICNGGYTVYDTLQFDCDTIKIEPYTSFEILSQCQDNNVNKEQDTKINLDYYNLGSFTIVTYKNGKELGRYAISLNSGTKEYIYNVLGGTPTDGNAEVFVEELYDVYLRELIENKDVNQITYKKDSGEQTLCTLPKINELRIKSVCDSVSDFVTIPYQSLERKNLGQRFLCTEKGVINSKDSSDNGFLYYDESKQGDSAKTCMTVGEIYTVKSIINEKGVKEYVYVPMFNSNNEKISVSAIKISQSNNEPNTVDAVKVLAYDAYFYKDGNGNIISETNMCNYREQFRCASTPWFVSEIKGDGKALQVKKLFRFHTISDGSCANSQIKISITNIDPDNGTFDVQIRDYNDSDSAPSILENYKELTMVPGDSKYIGLKIGTLNGEYESKSKYVLVEVIENDMTANCVPCGFLGYPIRSYDVGDSNTYISPSFTYNTLYDENIKDKKQYFGLSDLKGVDIDMLNYKGKNAYNGKYTVGYTHPFHLDSTVNSTIKEDLGVTITIDGDLSTKDIVWDSVSPDYTSDFDGAPVIGTESNMEGTLFEKKSLRKFTVYPYGGFDGWDIYRTSRTNSDQYKANKYKGNISNGYLSTFYKIENVDTLNLPTGAISSDYYAYLAGIRQFEMEERYPMNLFATPGIDYVNNTSLVNDVIDMIENRSDTLYIATTPDKPYGATDDVDEMYSSSDVVDNLDDTSIDTYYAATYYPWVKYYDSDNSIYINLPPTKDAVRNMADVDNKKYPWFAPAGIERGNVDCVKTHFFARLEDEDNVYDGRINPLKTFSKDGVKIWGNKTMYTGDTPMNRINVVRLMLYMRKLIKEAVIKLIFEPNDTTLASQFENIVKPIITQIKNDRGITDGKLSVSQTTEQMDAHEMSGTLFVKPTPTMEYLELNFVVTPQGVSFDE